MIKKTLVLFDLDGTLLDTSKGIFSCLRYACEKMDIPYPPDSQLHKFIGPPIKHSFIKILGQSDENADKGVALFREEYKNSGIKLSTPYEGMSELLSQLKKEGYKLGVATLKPQQLSDDILAYHDIAKFFDVIVGADMDAKYTKAHIMTLAMEKMGITSDKTIMIGDTASDAIGSEIAKVDFIAVDYGFGLRDNEIQNYPHINIATTTSQIKTIIDEYVG